MKKEEMIKFQIEKVARATSQFVIGKITEKEREDIYDQVFDFFKKRINEIN